MSKSKDTKKKDTRESATHYTEQARAIDRRIDRLEAHNVFPADLAGERMMIMARAAYDFLHVGAPNFITKAVSAAIDEAAKAHGLEMPTFAGDQTETPAQAVEKIETIFCLAQTYNPTPTDSRKHLARLLAAVLAHPELPESLYNDMADRINDFITDYLNLQDCKPELIEQGLEAHAVRCANEKGGRCK